MTIALHDPLDRPLRDLRISVTDRCNLRCAYCMPKQIFGRGYKFLDRGEMLTFEEIERLARLFVRLGVRKIRLTGGEPLLRTDLPELVGRLGALPLDLAMTSNGLLLAKHAKKLASAGLGRVTVSLDALDDATFSLNNGVGARAQAILDGIDAAAAAGLTPVKINMVVRRGINEHCVLPMARRFRGTPHVFRLIEFMDVGRTNGWRFADVVPARELVEMIDRELPLEPIAPAYRGEVARRWRYRDGRGEIGVIASVTEPFCGDCTRVRLSSNGKLYTCLFASTGTDLKRWLRDGVSDATIVAHLRGLWSRRADRYSEKRAISTGGGQGIEMSYIGG
ncbi:MAG: GTP 3',8-cyclase MoaA [Acidobacteriota bacterium]|nr:MAG: GTP 3',8-cyclase MoaA [Acidobacteriota bacterium]